jgi:hypothetical protein|nr:MAG TPA: hypothetical protein [Caudoviricetes sp.]
MYKKSKDIAHIYTNKTMINGRYYYIYLYKRKKDPPRGSCRTDPPPSLNPPTRKNIKKGLTISQIGDIIKSMKGGELK